MQLTPAVTIRRMDRSEVPHAEPHAGNHVEHCASTCRWALPTLFIRAPFWWVAEDCPWACIIGGTPRLLETTGGCATCARWEPHTGERVRLWDAG
jgi:hypothetical protein